MKLILPYFILILIMLQLIMKKNTKKEKESKASFWKRESDANSVRRKDISNLDYIIIPEALTTIQTTNSSAEAALKVIRSLTDKKILNLTGKSNTDLKLEYGTANLTVLTTYDENFINLARALATAGNQLLKDGQEEDALALLEFGISINTDISSNYVDLARYYKAHGKPEKIRQLLTRAELLQSLMKDSIITKLEQIQHGL